MNKAKTDHLSDKSCGADTLESKRYLMLDALHAFHCIDLPTHLASI